MGKQGARALAAIVMAAGEGKRFKSATPKVLHKLCGRPMLAHVLDSLAPLGAVRVALVVGRGAEAVQAEAKRHAIPALTFAPQARQLGTGDAARTGDDALGRFDGDVVVLPGDSPLVTTKTLRGLLAAHRKSGAAATILTAVVDDATGYGRIVRDAKGDVERIVEHADATSAERALDEVNSCMYVFDRAALRSALTKVERANRQNEFYLTDVIGILREKGERVVAWRAQDAAEIMGANSRAQLAELESFVHARVNEQLMADGVSIVDPSQTYIDPTVKVGRDTVIHPMTFLHGDTRIGAGCEIGPNVKATDSRIDNGARVLFAVLDQAHVGSEASVGPFAYLRPGARLAHKAKVGTFVEVKNSKIGEASKVPHLSYIGDADIGRDVNVGAASVTLNYDSETKVKSRTVIGDDAKIGGDTMMVAPVKIGKGAVTAAGSVVTKDVPPGSVVKGMPAKTFRKRKRSPEGEKKK
jgi:bifunctional UDP-N-acetylglucosamine pyrophosphorylase/glucosamine-1-phosphate N-acetyltransferase